MTSCGLIRNRWTIFNACICVRVILTLPALHCPFTNTLLVSHTYPTNAASPFHSALTHCTFHTHLKNSPRVSYQHTFSQYLDTQFFSHFIHPHFTAYTLLFFSMYAFHPPHFPQFTHHMYTFHNSPTTCTCIFSTIHPPCTLIIIYPATLPSPHCYNNCFHIIILVAIIISHILFPIVNSHKLFYSFFFKQFVFIYFPSLSIYYVCTEI